MFSFVLLSLNGPFFVYQDSGVAVAAIIKSNVSEAMEMLLYAYHCFVCRTESKYHNTWIFRTKVPINIHTYPRTHMWTLQTQTHPDQTRATKTLNGNEKDKDWCLCLFIYFLYLNLLVSIRSEWHWMAIFWCSSVVYISQR